MTPSTMPILSLHLERMQVEIKTMLANHNQEISKYIEQTLLETLNEDWVKAEIKTAVKLVIQQSIAALVTDYRIKHAVETAITDSLVDVIAGANKNEPTRS